MRGLITDNFTYKHDLVSPMALTVELEMDKLFRIVSE